MNWATHHGNSKHYGRLALRAVRRQEFDQAWPLYEQAAQEETLALNHLKNGSPKARGVAAVSAAHLWLNAGRPDRAKAVAIQAQQDGPLPSYSATQLHQLLTYNGILWESHPRLAEAVAGSPPQVTLLTPNSNCSAVANNDPNNSVIVQFMAPPSGMSWWTAMTSAALQPTVLNSNQGNSVVTFKAGLTVSYHAQGGNSFSVLLNGMIVDGGTDYAYTNGIVYVSTTA
jgi:hypothetical protein